MTSLADFSCSCDWDDCDAPEFYEQSDIKAARKAHRCYECSRPIQPGNPYQRTVGKWRGDVSSFATCRRCLAIIDWVKAHIPCFCFLHGSMVDDARTTIDDACFFAPDDTEGLREEFKTLLKQENDNG